MKLNQRFSTVAILLGAVASPMNADLAIDWVAEDGDFFDANWMQTYTLNDGGNPAGLGSVVRQTTGGFPDAYQAITLQTPAAGGQINLFNGYLGQTYNPATDGEIFWLNYFDDSINTSGAGDGHSVAAGLQQNGNIFFAPFPRQVSEEPDAIGRVDEWNPKRQLGLTQADFRPINGQGLSSSLEPDFSSTGAPITFGYVRATSGGPNPSGTSRETGIDNWRIEVQQDDVPEPLNLPDAQLFAQVTTSQDFDFPNPSIENTVTNSIPGPIDLLDEAFAERTETGPATATGRGKARANIGEGLGVEATSGLPFGSASGITRGRTNATAFSERRFTAVTSGTATEVDIDLVLTGEGELEFAPQGIPFGAPGGISSNLSLVVTASQEDASGNTVTTTLSSSFANMQGTNTVLASDSGAWAGEWELFEPLFPTDTYVYKLEDFFVLMEDVLTVPVGEDFSIKFEMTGVTSSNRTDWSAVVEFFNTANFELQTSTPDAQIIERSVVPEPGTGLLLVLGGLGLITRSRRGAAA